MSGRLFLPSGTDINRSGYTRAMTGFEHGTQKVKFKMGVHFPDPGWKVTHAMMSFCKNINGFDMSLFQSLYKSFCIKISADMRYQGRRMKIQMYLAVGQFFVHLQLL